MIVRRRPLLRAAAVGGGAYAMGRMSAQRAAAQDQQANLQQQAPGPAAQPAADAATASVLDQLSQLSSLHQQGALTDAEFAAAKAKLLGT
jgi:hypothetical protein